MHKRPKYLLEKLKSCEYEIIEFYDFNNEEIAYQKELEFIKTIGRKSKKEGPLLNVTPGGGTIQKLEGKTEQFIEKAIKVHGNKYDYSKVNYVNNNTPVTIICPVIGEFKQLPLVHLRGCIPGILANNIKLTTEEYIKKANQTHNNKFNYSKTIYDGMNKKITIICPIHGEFRQCASSHLTTKTGCFKCGNKVKSLQEFIDSSNKIHNNKYDYSNCVLKPRDEKQIIICPKHGQFEQSFGRHIYQKFSCPLCKIYK